MNLSEISLFTIYDIFDKKNWDFLPSSFIS